MALWLSQVHAPAVRCLVTSGYQWVASREALQPRTRPVRLVGAEPRAAGALRAPSVIGPVESEVASAATWRATPLHRAPSAGLAAERRWLFKGA